MSALTLSAKLERVDNSTPWGFRLQGGKDFSSPLTIQRVTPGSLAAKCGLELGDVIKKIGGVLCDDLKHKEAQQAIISASNSLELTLERGGAGSRPPPPSAVAPSYQPSTYNVSQQQPYQPSIQSYNAAPKPFAPKPAAPEPKVPVMVNKQYNTPINLYSVNNVVDSLSSQTQAMNLSNTPASGNSASPYSATPQPVHERSSSWSDNNNDHDYQHARQRSWPSPADPLYDQHASSWSSPDQAHERQPSSWSPSYTNHNSSVAPPSSDSPAVVEPPPRFQMRPSSQAQSRSFKMLQSMVSDSEAPSGGYPPPPWQQKSTLSSESDSSLPLPPPPSDLCPPTSTREVNRSVLPPPPSEDVKIYRPSETFKLVHEQTQQDNPTRSEPQIKSRTFRVLQQQLGGQGAGPPPAKPAPQQNWGAPAARPAAASPAKKPWAPPQGPRNPGSARFGKKGDAQFRKTSDAGRVPVCNTCGQAIRGPFVVALDKTWCPDHFLCANPQCGVQLVDVGFVEENGQLYCERDYEKYFAPPCKKCNRAIVGECVTALNQTYHPHCFLCAHCRQPIGTASFHMEDGNPYCEKDWQSLYQTKCVGCQFPIEPGDRWVEALGGNFHSECFNCSVCQVNLEGQGFYAKGGKPYCKRHA